MGLQHCLLRVLSEYATARGGAFASHPLAQFIRGEFRDTVAGIIQADEELVCKGSAGQGVWARGPWIGIFYTLITEGAQSGYYPVYLFREDMKGVYLSLNQGMTEAKQHYKADASTALKAKAGNFRALLGSDWKQFPEIEIDLAPSMASNPTAFYQAGNVCAKYYPADNLPSEENLVADLLAMLALYSQLYEAETLGGTASQLQVDQPILHYEDATRFRIHKRIERNAKLSKSVKEIKGCVCEVCKLDFEKLYGELGKGYIEAHHLRPLASLKGHKVPMHPVHDFAVLCANCHRMIHRSGCVSDVEEFRLKHFLA